MNKAFLSVHSYPENVSEDFEDRMAELDKFDIYGLESSAGTRKSTESNYLTEDRSVGRKNLYAEELYDQILQDTDGRGSFRSDDLQAITEYDRIAVGGFDAVRCVLNSSKIIHEVDEDVLVGVVPELSYTGVDEAYLPEDYSDDNRKTLLDLNQVIESQGINDSEVLRKLYYSGIEIRSLDEVL